jgi:hypothetical protein
MDTVASMYNSGYDLMKYQEYSLAKERLLSVYKQYPKNYIYAPKALYVLGYMFENHIKNFDSAAWYYDILIKEYPETEYAKELMLSVKYKDLVDSKADIPDSLKTKDVAIYTADTSIINAPYDSTLLSKPLKKDGYSLDDLKNPKKLLEKTKTKIQEQINKASDAITDPELLNKTKDAIKENIKEGIKIPSPEDFLPDKEPDGEPPPDIEGETPPKKEGE